MRARQVLQPQRLFAQERGRLFGRASALLPGQGAKKHLSRSDLSLQSGGGIAFGRPSPTLGCGKEHLANEREYHDNCRSDSLDSKVVVTGRQQNEGNANADCDQWQQVRARLRVAGESRRRRSLHIPGRAAVSGHKQADGIGIVRRAHGRPEAVRNQSLPRNHRQADQGYSGERHVWAANAGQYPPVEKSEVRGSRAGDGHESGS